MMIMISRYPVSPNPADASQPNFIQVAQILVSLIFLFTMLAIPEGPSAIVRRPFIPHYQHVYRFDYNLAHTQ